MGRLESGGGDRRTMQGINRRQFLQGAGALALSAAVGPALHGLASFVARSGERGQPAVSAAYGPLQPVADLRDGAVRLALPAGFRYRSFGMAGTAMSDGRLTPLAPDGMAAFTMPDGTLRLVRNHEDRNPPSSGSIRTRAALAHDPLAGGGTTTLVIEPVERRLLRDFVSLSGTIVNCAGGPTPWGSWLSCEETTAGPADGWSVPHGYVFEVPAARDAPVLSSPLRALGRFAHEAVAIDPATGIAYLTEDNHQGSGFYRFLPDVPWSLRAGRLQMLAIEGHSDYDASRGQRPGLSLPVRWVDIPQPDPPAGGPSVADQGFRLGAARFERLEGCWFGQGRVYFNSTTGGNAGAGQVWEYRPDAGGGRLSLLFESPDKAVLNCPDHLTVSPRGALLLCEDGDARNRLRGLGQDGTIFDFALNLMNDAEWAGATFAVHSGPSMTRDDLVPGGHATLFVNLLGSTQGPNPPAAGQEGMTFAIWGPWTNGPL